MSRRGENIYKRKDGRWEGRYKNGFKADGKVKYSSVYGRSYSEVRKVLNEVKAENKDYMPSGIYTFGELSALWIEHIKLTVKESTYANYMFKLEKHIKPEFENVRYEKLTAENLNRFISRKIADGLSYKYVSDIAAVIKSVCRFAHRMYNYQDKSELIIIPKKQPSAERKILSDVEQNTLKNRLIQNPTSSNIGILLSFSTGIRIGELCALKQSDIDFEKRTITVRSTVQRIKDFNGKTKTKLIITPPKSEKSFREIPIPEFILPMLKSICSDKNSYLLSGDLNIIEPRTMQYRFKSILKKLKLSDVTFHSLRHAFATKAIIIGFDMKTLSEILGHSSVEITLNRYVHSSSERKAMYMNMMSERFA